MPSVSSGPVVYEIPCTCGKILTITAGQAGSQISCECGAVVDVPTIRELRQQFDKPGVSPSRAPARVEAQNAKDEFSRSVLVTLAIGLIVLGGLTFGSLYFFQRSLEQDVDPRLFEWLNAQKAQMDKIPPEDLWTEWQFARDHGLGEHNALPQVKNKVKAQGAWYGAYFGLGASGLGVVLLVFAALLPRRNRVT